MTRIDLDAREQEVVFALAVGLEGARRAVGRVDVEFDREGLRLPVAIELIPLDRDVGLRAGQPGGDHEVAEAALEVGAERRRLRPEGGERGRQPAVTVMPAGSGEQRFEAPTVEELVVVRALQEAFEVTGGSPRREVEDGPRRPRSAGSRRPGRDPPSPAARSGRRSPACSRCRVGAVRWIVPGRDRSRPWIQAAVLWLATASGPGEHRRQAPSLPTDRRVPDRVDAPVQRDGACRRPSGPRTVVRANPSALNCWVVTTPCCRPASWLSPIERGVRLLSGIDR